MHKCASEGDAEGIEALIKEGYSVDESDHDSWAPIHHAAWYDHGFDDNIAGTYVSSQVQSSASYSSSVDPRQLQSEYCQQ
jgi:hypothetical protein